MINNSLQPFRLNLPVGSIESYLGYVNQLPLLSPEEEKALATRLFHDGDLNAAQGLILSHLRYVVKVAKGYNGYGLPLSDLIQEGNIGLMKAVRRFNPDQGARLVSFAVHWIKAEIHEFIIRNWRIVKVATTKAQRKLFFNLRQLKKQLTWFRQAEAEDIAQTLNVPVETVHEMESRMSHHDVSFDGSDDEDDEFSAAPVHYLADQRYNPALQLEAQRDGNSMQAGLYKALEKLDERSKIILESRWLNENKLTLQELAERLGVSAERVRQLEKMAMDKVKLLMVPA